MFMRDNGRCKAKAKSLKPPILAPGWAPVCSQESCVSYSPKESENLNITTLNRCTGRLLVSPHGTTTETLPYCANDFMAAD